MAVALQQAQRQSVSCGYWPGMRMGTSATPTKTCTTRLLPGLCSNLERAGEQHYSRMVLLLSSTARAFSIPPDQYKVIEEPAVKSAKGIDPKDGQSEVSPDYAVKLGMVKAREQLEDMPLYNPTKFRGVLNLNNAVLAKGMLVINPSLEQEIWLPEGCLKIRGYVDLVCFFFSFLYLYLFRLVEFLCFMDLILAWRLDTWLTHQRCRIRGGYVILQMWELTGAAQGFPLFAEVRKHRVLAPPRPLTPILISDDEESAESEGAESVEVLWGSNAAAASEILWRQRQSTRPCWKRTCRRARMLCRRSGAAKVKGEPWSL